MGTLTRSLLVAGLVLGGAASASGALLPPASSRTLPHGFVVLDERDEPRDLRERSLGAPSLLLPIFTRCGGTCPLTALAMKDALAKAEAPFRVVVLSFDTEDGANDLKEFRERFGLPADWVLVRSADGAATRSFLDQLDFHFMKIEGGFEHPSATFVFSPRGAWAATLTGTTFSKGTLETGWRLALAADDPSALQRLRAWLIRPEAWILLACGGTALSLLVILVLARRAQAVNRVASATLSPGGDRARAQRRPPSARAARPPGDPAAS